MFHLLLSSRHVEITQLVIAHLIGRYLLQVSLVTLEYLKTLLYTVWYGMLLTGWEGNDWVL